MKLADNDQYMPDEGEQVIEVEKFVIHPDFQDGIARDYWMLNDIALIKVNRLRQYHCMLNDINLILKGE